MYQIGDVTFRLDFSTKIHIFIHTLSIYFSILRCLMSFIFVLFCFTLICPFGFCIHLFKAAPRSIGSCRLFAESHSRTASYSTGKGPLQMGYRAAFYLTKVIVCSAMSVPSLQISLSSQIQVKGVTPFLD